MTHSLTFIKNNGLVTIEDLENLTADLNAADMEVSYYFFVLNSITKKHHNLGVQNEAKRYLSKKSNIQDNSDYMNNCLAFLKEQLRNNLTTRALTPTEIAQRKAGLEEDIRLFTEECRSIQKACFRFISEYFHKPFGQSSMAA